MAITVRVRLVIKVRYKLFRYQRNSLQSHCWRRVGSVSIEFGLEVIKRYVLGIALMDLRDNSEIINKNEVFIFLSDL